VTASAVATRSPCRRLSLLPLGVLHNCTPFDLALITNQVSIAFPVCTADLASIMLVARGNKR